MQASEHGGKDHGDERVVGRVSDLMALGPPIGMDGEIWLKLGTAGH